MMDWIDGLPDWAPLLFCLTFFLYALAQPHE
jgi:hypothetical protein